MCGLGSGLVFGVGVDRLGGLWVLGFVIGCFGVFGWSYGEGIAGGDLS